MDRPGFTIRRVELDDDVIELESLPEDEAEFAGLRDLLDETVAELRKVREAHLILFEETKSLREELAEARAELRRRDIDAAIAGLGLAPSDLTVDQAPE